MTAWRVEGCSRLAACAWDSELGRRGRLVWWVAEVVHTGALASLLPGCHCRAPREDSYGEASGGGGGGAQASSPCSSAVSGDGSSLTSPRSSAPLHGSACRGSFARRQQQPGQEAEGDASGAGEVSAALQWHPALHSPQAPPLADAPPPQQQQQQLQRRQEARGDAAPRQDATLLLPLASVTYLDTLPSGDLAATLLAEIDEEEEAAFLGGGGGGGGGGMP